MLNLVRGVIADLHDPESLRFTVFDVLEGPHTDHTVLFLTRIGQNGFVSKEVICSCGKSWKGAIHSPNFSVPERGDQTLKALKIWLDARKVYRPLESEEVLADIETRLFFPHG